MGIIEPVYALFIGLLFFSSISSLLANLDVALERHVNKLIDNFSLIALTILIACSFWFFGWKYGLASMAFIYATNIITGIFTRRMLGGAKTGISLNARAYIGNNEAVIRAEMLAKYTPSIFSLIYPISATLWIGTATPASATEVIGYGIANIGYLMFVAAFFAGTFRLFRLTKRWQFYVTGAVLLIIGTAIINLENIRSVATR